MCSKKVSKDWRNSPAHWKLLAAYKSPNAPENYPLQSALGWKKALGESISRATKRFLEEGLIAPVDDVSSLLVYKYTQEELRQMARTLGLSERGSKATLAKRIVEANPDFARRKAKVRHMVYQCTKEGETLVKQWKAHEKQRRDRVETQIMELLRQKKFKEAVNVFRAYERTLAFQRKMLTSGGTWGVNWAEVQREIKDLWKMQTPRILEEVSHEHLTALRVVASMSLIFGGRIKKSWLPNEAVHPTLENDAAARMLIFAQNHRRELAELKRAGFKKVRVLAAQDANTCESCRSLAKVYPINKVPELPNPNCTSPWGCRCTLVAEL